MRKERWVETRVDMATGESSGPVAVEREVNVESIVIGRPYKRKGDMDFVKIYPAFFSSFLEELGVDDGKARLVLYLVYKALRLPSESNNIIYADNDSLMSFLKISKPTLIKYIADLCELKVIKRLKPRTPLYQVNPEMIYRGTLTKFRESYIEEGDNNAD